MFIFLFIILFLDFTAPEMEFEASEKALKASEANSEIGFKFKRCHFRGKKYDSTAFLLVIMYQPVFFPMRNPVPRRTAFR